MNISHNCFVSNKFITSQGTSLADENATTGSEPKFGSKMSKPGKRNLCFSALVQQVPPQCQQQPRGQDSKAVALILNNRGTIRVDNTHFFIVGAEVTKKLCATKVEMNVGYAESQVNYMPRPPAVGLVVDSVSTSSSNR